MNHSADTAQEESMRQQGLQWGKKHVIVNVIISANTKHMVRFSLF